MPGDAGTYIAGVARRLVAEASGWRTARRCLALAAFVGGVLVMVPLFAIGTGPSVSADGVAIDPTLLDAYLRAGAKPVVGDCTVRWSVLAAIGQVESTNAAGRTIAKKRRPKEGIAEGDVSPPIVGMTLDGSEGVAAIADTDAGELDGDAVWDRAVGPMQFIPSSWRAFGRDGNGDGEVNPQNVYDAAAAAAAHLCLTAPGDYSVDAELAVALRRYNNSETYVSTVLAWVAHYDALDSEAAVRAMPRGAYHLPLDAGWFAANPAWFTSTHHDYPAADLGVPTGTPVHAVVAGRVRATTAESTRCGLGVVLAGHDGWDYVYCHLSVVDVSAGDGVAAGDVLGVSGNTGRSFGPHLHFGVQSASGGRVCPQSILAAWYRGEAIDPASADTTSCVG